MEEVPKYEEFLLTHPDFSVFVPFIEKWIFENDEESLKPKISEVKREIEKEVRDIVYNHKHITKIIYATKLIPYFFYLINMGFLSREEIIQYMKDFSILDNISSISFFNVSFVMMSKENKRSFNIVSCDLDPWWIIEDYGEYMQTDIRKIFTMILLWNIKKTKNVEYFKFLTEEDITFLSTVSERDNRTFYYDFFVNNIKGFNMFGESDEEITQFVGKIYSEEYDIFERIMKLSYSNNAITVLKEYMPFSMPIKGGCWVRFIQEIFTITIIPANEYIQHRTYWFNYKYGNYIENYALTPQCNASFCRKFLLYYNNYFRERRNRIFSNYYFLFFKYLFMYKLRFSKEFISMIYNEEITEKYNDASFLVRCIEEIKNLYKVKDVSFSVRNSIISREVTDYYADGFSVRCQRIVSEPYVKIIFRNFIEDLYCDK